MSIISFLKQYFLRKQTMNIIELLKDNVKKDDFFFNEYSGANERENIEKVVTEFLNCENERHRETLASLIINYSLLPHAKGAEIAPLLGVMNMFELYEHYNYRENRKHLVHQVYTFLLGLLIYENVEKVRKKIDAEMRLTTKLFSSGNEKGEFLFRWRLASLTHDLGNGISLFENDNEKINKFIFYLQLLSNESWGYGHDGISKLLFLDDEKKSLELLDQVDGTNNLTKFFDYLNSKPYKKIYYDHGIMSSIILLKLLDRMYSKYNGQTINYKGHRVSFKKPFFEKSIVQTAYAIAIHNLDFYPDIVSNIWGTTGLYNFEKKPFCWLLKICDTLQEWNKTKASDETDYLAPEKIVLTLEPDKILIKKYPNKQELKQKIADFFVAEKVVQID